MTQVCKHNIVIITFTTMLFLTSIVSIFGPQTTLAQQSTDNIFCSRLSSISSRLNSQIDQKITSINNTRADKEKKLNEIFSKRDQDISDTQAKWDSNRQEHYTKLLEKSQTDSQKQAINAFKSSVEVSIAERRQSVDKVVDTYYDNVIGIISVRNNSIDVAIADYKSSVATALAKAQASCDAGNDSETVRKELKSDIEGARNEIQSIAFGESSIVATTKAVQLAGQSTISRVIEHFNYTMQQAQTTLKESIK